MRRLTIGLVAGLLGFGLTVPAVAQSAPTLTIGQVPAVAGADTDVHATFTASGDGYLVGICRAGTDFSDLIAAAGRCSLLEVGETSGSTVTTTLDLPYFFTPYFGGATVRCEQVACELAVGIGTGTFPTGSLTEFVASPIAFFAEVRGLTRARPGDDVSVFMTRFGTADQLDAVQCPLEGPYDACTVGTPIDETVASPNGTVVAARFLEAPDGAVVDCVEVSCGIGLRARGISGTDGTPRHYLRPLTIDPPLVFLDGPREVADVPRSIRMRAEGLPERSTDTTIHQCVDSLLTEPFDPSVACGASDAPVEAGATDYVGSLTVVGTVDVGAEAYSCAVEQCVAVLSSRPSPPHSHPVAWSIRDLTYRSMVHRSGGIFTTYFFDAEVNIGARTFHEPGGAWEYAFCTGRPTLEARDTACEAFTPLPDTGDRTIIRTPARSVLSTGGGETRCGVTPCSLMVVYTPPGGDPDYFVEDIGFRRPQARLSQTDGLVDGQTVDVEEIGHLAGSPGAGAWAMQCGLDRSGPVAALRCANVGTVEADFAGHFVGSIDVVRTLVDVDGNVVRCDESRCAIAVVSMAPDLRVLSAHGIAITFAPPPAG